MAHRLGISSGILFATLLASMATAQNAAETEEVICEVTAESRLLRIAVCDGVAAEDTLAEFGRTACAGRLPCGVWFWRDPAAAPEVAPDNHDGLTQAQVTSSLGVFVAEQDLVIRIERD